MRDTIRELGERLSDLGYVVLMPDFSYRNGQYDPIDMRTAWARRTGTPPVVEGDRAVFRIGVGVVTLER